MSLLDGAPYGSWRQFLWGYFWVPLYYFCVTKQPHGEADVAVCEPLAHWLTVTKAPATVSLC